MKFALIGQEIPALLPSLLADLLFAARQEADICIEERNAAMQDVLEHYVQAVTAYAGLRTRLTVSGRRAEVLLHADCVIYAGDLMASTRFQQDREALMGSDSDPDDPGLSDQARPLGGLGGLLHTIRQAENIAPLCEDMQRYCPGALVVTLGQPVARTVALFEHFGFTAYGLTRSPRRGAGGLDGICKALGRETTSVHAEIAGLPDFAFLIGLRDAATGEDLLPEAKRLARDGRFGRLAARWLNQYEALAIGRTTDHAQFLPAQADFVPEARPDFGESVERRKERILWMNTAGQRGLTDKEGQMAQLLLLSRAPSQRPMQLALAVLRGDNAVLSDICRRNQGTLPDLPASAIIEAGLTLQNGQPVTEPQTLPPSLADICLRIDDANRLSAQAATGDRTALREAIEEDPAMDGLDRLYLHDVAARMIDMHSDILTLWTDEEEA